MGASTRLLIQYITGALLVLLVLFHFASRIPQLRGADSFIETLSPEAVYEDVGGASGIILLLLAYAALLHGLNGLRGILLEWTSGRYEKAITAVLALLFIVFAGLATYTVIGTQPPAQ